MEQKNIIPYCICDNDSDKWGKLYYGYNVVPMKSLKGIDFFLIISTAINNYEEIVSGLDKTIIRFHMCMPFRVDKAFLQMDEIIKSKDTYKKIYDLLEDRYSKKLFVKLLNYKLTGDATSLLDEIRGDTFFDSELIPFHASHVFVDCGAYTGDTLIRFYAYTGGVY